VRTHICGDLRFREEKASAGVLRKDRPKDSKACDSLPAQTFDCRESQSARVHSMRRVACLGLRRKSLLLLTCMSFMSWASITLFIVACCIGRRGNRSRALAFLHFPLLPWSRIPKVPTTSLPNWNFNFDLLDLRAAEKVSLGSYPRQFFDHGARVAAMDDGREMELESWHSFGVFSQSGMLSYSGMP
jgi:hypothetical protein